MSAYILEFNSISYQYPHTSRLAIQELSLKIPQGKRCGLIGQNGCGKTTLFLLANGSYKPTEGAIFWQGQPISYNRSELVHLRQQVGLVFQNPEHQLVASTVQEDISYGLCNLALSEAEIGQRVEEAINDFDLNELTHQPIAHLSLGQKKRVSLADVMVLRPNLLLLDEPTAYLDHLHTKELLKQLQKIHYLGTSIIVASHDLDFLYSWADWLFVMDSGRLVIEGTPDNVFTQKEVLEDLQLGLPLRMQLLEEMKG